MQYIEIMRPIIKKAGDMVMSHFRGSLQIQRKKDLSVVTNIDVMSQEILLHGLCRALPGSGFIAEEAKQHEIKEFTWVIDPIDGTKNFVRGLPYFCINVALMQHKEVIAAVTYFPAMDEWFYAQKGAGAWRNGVRLDMTQRNWSQAGALVVVSDFRLRHCELLGKIKHQLKHIEHGVRFRVCGAAALDLAYCASGSYDAVLFENLKWWDAAGGTLLITEAGGTICQYDGSPVDQSFRSLIAGNKEMCDLILPALYSE
ncbi:MAG TPA: inositol monophosphatase family protein [Candidatus Saccharimonadales bacterium]|nr:inositol monophosphatase family protein [Candidatus Saccharimonadales bacterium]